jgi:hypothetical protein
MRAQRFSKAIRPFRLVGIMTTLDLALQLPYVFIGAFLSKPYAVSV